jgi:LsmAD domain
MIDRSFYAVASGQESKAAAILMRMQFAGIGPVTGGCNGTSVLANKNLLFEHCFESAADQMIGTREGARCKGERETLGEKRKKGGTAPSEARPRAEGEDALSVAEERRFVEGREYSVALTTGTVGKGEYAGCRGKSVRFSRFCFANDPKILYEISIRTENIERVEKGREEQEEKSSGRRLEEKDEGEKQTGESSMVVLKSGKSGWGVVVEAGEEEVEFDEFSFLQDPEIKFGITISRKDMAELVLPSEMKKNVKKLGEDVLKKRGEWFLDGEIGKKKKAAGREYTYFYEGAGAPVKEEFEKHKKWNQFRANEELFGLKPRFDEHMYTVRIDRNSEHYKKYAKEAEQIAHEMDSAISMNIHVEEERGRIADLDEDEKYGSVAETLKTPKKKALPKKRREECKMQVSITTSGSSSNEGTDYSSKLFQRVPNASRLEVIKIIPNMAVPREEKREERKKEDARPAKSAKVEKDKDSQEGKKSAEACEKAEPTENGERREKESKDSKEVQEGKDGREESEEKRADRMEKGEGREEQNEQQARGEGGGEGEERKILKSLKTKFNISAPSFNPLAAKKLGLVDAIREKAKKRLETHCRELAAWGAGPSYLLYSDSTKGARHPVQKNPWK